MDVPEVVRVARCDLCSASGIWSFCEANRAAIAAHWSVRQRESPALFNGTIHLLGQAFLTGEAFTGRLLPVDFASYLYWRDQGFPPSGVKDCFGSALLRSAEGYVLFGRQRSGNMNGGLAYPPGGFIDERDVAPDGTVDIDASVGREVEEETGLARADLARVPGYIIANAGPLLSIAVEYRSALPSKDLRERVLTHIGNERAAELADAVIMHGPEDIETATPAYAKLLLHTLFGRPESPTPIAENGRKRKERPVPTKARKERTAPAPQYWLLKSEPEDFSYAMLEARGPAGEPWTGVRNYQARNNMRAMRLGDLGFFYHSGGDKEIVGILKVSALAHPDPEADDPAWECVDVVAVRALPRSVTLAAVKTAPKLRSMALVRAPRLSVQPVTTAEWTLVCAMGGLTESEIDRLPRLKRG